MISAGSAPMRMRSSGLRKTLLFVVLEVPLQLIGSLIIAQLLT